MNSLQVKPGSSFACFGAGAVGMSALLAAQACSAGTTIAVDVVEPRLKLAAELGVTHVINGRSTDALQAIQDLTNGGVDYALDSTGAPAVIAQAIASLAPRGTVGLVAGAGGAKAEFDIVSLFSGGRTIKGIIEGDSVARIFIPRLVRLHMQGKFRFDKLVKFYDFEDINQAAKDSEDGVTVKPVIRIASGR
jgi:aryl-alcohol dehydrogenase